MPNIGRKFTEDKIELIKSMLLDKEGGMTYNDMATKYWLPRQRVIKIVSKGRFLQKYGKLKC